MTAFVTIREAEPRDETGLRSLWCTAWHTLFPAFDYQMRWPLMREHWREINAEIYVAARGRDIVGMIVLAALPEDETLLDQIALHPAEQGSGTAHLLMEFAKRNAPQALKLSVNAFNQRAIHFYEREGFIRTANGINSSSGLATYDYEWRE